MHFHGILFQVPVIQLLLGQVGLVSGDQMLSIWRFVVVGAVVAAAVLTPSTDPLTQMLLAGPLLGLYLGGAWMVKLIGRQVVHVCQRIVVHECSCTIGEVTPQSLTVAYNQ